MSKYPIVGLICVIVSLLLSACGTVVRPMPVSFQVAQTPVNEPRKGSVQIVSITDDRTNPEESLSLNVGRNIFRPVGFRPAQELATNIVTEAFGRRGFDLGQSGADVTVTGRITEMTMTNVPAMWSFSLQSHVTLVLNIESAGKAKTVTAKGFGKNICQLMKADNIELSMHRAFEDLLQNLDRELETAGF